MSLLDFTRRTTRRAVEPVAEKIVEAGAAVVDLFKERNWRMSVAQIDEKLTEAQTALDAAEAAHREAAADYNLGFVDDEKVVAKRRKELVAAREKVEDLTAARAAALMNAADADADAQARAEAEWTEKLESAVDELVPLAQKVENKLDELAVALSALDDGVAMIKAMGSRARPAHVAVFDAVGHLPTLVGYKLGRFHIVPNGAHFTTSPSEIGLVKRLPDPKVMVAMCPPKQPAAPGKNKHGGSYFIIPA